VFTDPLDQLHLACASLVVFLGLCFLGCVSWVVFLGLSTSCKLILLWLRQCCGRFGPTPTLKKQAPLSETLLCLYSKNNETIKLIWANTPSMNSDESLLLRFGHDFFHLGFDLGVECFVLFQGNLGGIATLC